MRIVHVEPSFNEFSRAVKLYAFRSKCLKRKLCALLVCEHGQRMGMGFNGPPEAPGYCPRMELGSEENYALCEENCPGERHAEIAALEDAGFFVGECSNCEMYLYGHDHACQTCIDELEHHGIKYLFIVSD